MAARDHGEISSTWIPSMPSRQLVFVMTEISFGD